MNFIWKFTIGEILFGQRGITKMSHLWLSVAVILLLGSVSDLKEDFFISLYLFFVVLFKVMFSIQVNDLCDKQSDEAVGKRRWIFHLPLFAGIAISLGLIVAGFAIIILTNGSIQVILAYSTSILFGLFYSLPPVRFKERGIWGLMAYALAATLIYVLVPWVWLGSSLVLLVFLVATVYLDKWVQLNFHQIVDYQADLKNQVQTYAVKVGLEQTRNTLRMAALLASLSMLLLLIYILFFSIPETLPKIALAATVILIVAASSIYTRILKKNTKQASDLVRELPWIYLGLTYLVFCLLPPVVFFYLALKEPLMGVVTALSALSLLGISWHSIRYKYS